MNNRILKKGPVNCIIGESVYQRLQEQLSLQYQKTHSQQRYSKDGIRIVGFQNQHFKKSKTRPYWNNNYVKPSVCEKNNYQQDFTYNDHAITGDYYNSLSNNKFGLKGDELGVGKTTYNFSGQVSNPSSVTYTNFSEYAPNTFSWLAQKMPYWHHKKNSQVKSSKDGVLIVSMQKNAFKKDRRKLYWNKENTNYLSASRKNFGYRPAFCNNYPTRECFNYANAYVNIRSKPHNFDLFTAYNFNTKIGSQQVCKQPYLETNQGENRSLGMQNQVLDTPFTYDTSSTKIGEQKPDVIFEKTVSGEEKRVLAVVTITSDTEDDDPCGATTVLNCDSSQMPNQDLNLQSECSRKKSSLDMGAFPKNLKTTFPSCDKNDLNPFINIGTGKAHHDNLGNAAINFLPQMQVTSSSSERLPNVGHIATTIENQDSLLNQRAEFLKYVLGFRPHKLHLLGIHPSLEDQQKLIAMGYDVKKGRYMEDEDFILLENLKILQENFDLDLSDTLLGNRRRKSLQNLFADTHLFFRLARNLDNRTLYSAYKRAGGLLVIHQKIEELKAQFRRMNFPAKKGVGKKTEMQQSTRSRGVWSNAEKIQLLKAMDLLTYKKKIEFTLENSFWAEIAKHVRSRSAKQCKSRWFQFHKFNFKVV